MMEDTSLHHSWYLFFFLFWSLLSVQLIKTCGYTPWSYISLEVTIKGFATTGLQVPGNRNVGWKSEASTHSLLI